MEVFKYLGVLFMYDNYGALDGSMFQSLVFSNEGVDLVGYGEKRDELKGKALYLLFSLCFNSYLWS